MRRNDIQWNSTFESLNNKQFKDLNVYGQSIHIITFIVDYASSPKVPTPLHSTPKRKHSSNQYQTCIEHCSLKRRKTGKNQQIVFNDQTYMKLNVDYQNEIPPIDFNNNEMIKTRKKILTEKKICCRKKLVHLKYCYFPFQILCEL
ncbi:hypothetical protein GJ496_005485 [Pomphorhynchus laevis]|nr:hypothetical protein GJ496_005485 [Pomphorhynchus laevis]